MARTASKAKEYTIRVASNPDFCGIDAGGVQFAHGQAVLPECRMVNWFREHEGYEVTENVAAEDKKAE